MTKIIRPKIYLHEGGIVVEKNGEIIEADEAYEEMIDALIECKRALSKYASKSSIDAWFSAKQALLKAGCTEVEDERD